MRAALAGTVGSFLTQHQTAVNVVTGAVVVLFGLNYLGVIKGNLFRGGARTAKASGAGFFSAMVLGATFSVGWTPCVGAFLGSALMLASQQAHALQGVLMLLAYSAGLGVPFVVSAVLIDSLKASFDAIKRHYALVNTVSGLLLVAVGILMATGTIGRLLSLLS